MLFKIRYLICTLSLLFLFLLVQTNLCIASNVIQPFGNIEWEDNVVEVVKKLQKRKDIKNINVKFQVGAYYPDPIQIDKKDNAKKVLNEKIPTVINFVQNKLWDDEQFFKYKYSNGYKKTLVVNYDGSSKRRGSNKIKVISEPIYIHNIKFKVNVVFSFSMGYFKKYPNKIMKIKNNNEYIYLPYFLEKVILKSSSSSIPQKSENKIYDTLATKYNSYIVDKDKSHLFILCKDENDNSEIRLTRYSNLNIKYKNLFIFDNLEKLYEEHKMKMNEKSRGSSQDSSDQI